MINKVVKFDRYAGEKPYFSILLPTWNNLTYLQNCIHSLRINSSLPLQIIVCVNEGKDGTLDWLAEQAAIDYIHAEQNIGICYGVNACRSLVRADYLVYMNDDMYVLPGWDRALDQVIQNMDTTAFMLSATMIEPVDTGNPCVVVRDYGRDLKSFQEEQLLQDRTILKRSDWSGSTWPPNVVHVDYWDLVGGLSPEYSPGMYSDPDFSKKLYEAGVRIFRGVGDSLVYHFGAKSTQRIKKNKGRTTFLLKWGITARTFFKEYLRMGEDYQGALKTKLLSWEKRLLNKLKRLWTQLVN